MATQVDVLVCPRSAPGAPTLGRFTPGADRQAALSLAPATTMWMIHGVHGDASSGGPDAFPAICPGLAQLDVLVLPVGNLPNGGCAAREDPPLLA